MGKKEKERIGKAISVIKIPIENVLRDNLDIQFIVDRYKYELNAISKNEKMMKKLAIYCAGGFGGGGGGGSLGSSCLISSSCTSLISTLPFLPP